MNNREQYKALQTIVPQIEEKLKDNSFEGIKGLILWLTKSDIYIKLKEKENSLNLLDFFCKIWMEEKKELVEENDIFTNINSLDDIQKKYRDVQYTILRIENQLPREWCDQGVKKIIEDKVSGIAIVEIAIRETVETKTNIIKISEYLQGNYAMVLAIEMLQYAQKMFPDFTDFVLREADCWMYAKQWKMALKCLNKIDNPDDATKDIINELQQVVKNEGI